MWLALVAPLAVGFGCSDGGGSSGGGTTPPPVIPPPTGQAVVQGSLFGGAPVAGATIAFVESFTAGASTSIQPLEDLAPTAAFKVVTDEEGGFSIEVDPGLYYVYVTPEASDTVHLPGGNLCRDSISLAAGSTSIFNIELSEQPSESAAFVGSSTCLACHPSHEGAKKTLHFLGFRKLTTGSTTETSSLQDLSGLPESDVGLTYYPDGNPNDNTGADAYGYRITTSNGYNILLGLDGTGHFQAIESLDETKVSEKLYIEFVYGGEGLYKQRFVTRLDVNGQYTTVPADGSYQIVPGQYNETKGDFFKGGEVTVPLWVTYHGERWAAPDVDGGPVALAPAQAKAFDNECASCHFTGMTLTRTASGLFQADAVDDPGGPIDFDGDGSLDEINVGCERCHGPGSEHAAQGKGYIVHPEYLSIGRGNLICGQCHTRGKGNATIDGEGLGGMPYRNNPDTGEVEVQWAGISPAEFYGQADGSGILPNFGTTGGYFNPINFTTDSHSWMDKEQDLGTAYDHSKGHRQQYLDHARSTHTHNPFEMVACWSCHNAHERERRAQVAKPFENNVLCLSCHATHGDFEDVTKAMVKAVEDGGASSEEMKVALDEHQTDKTFEMVGTAMHLGPSAYGDPAGNSQLGRCTTCHMPKTAKTASWITDVDGATIRGDITDHTFGIIAPQVTETMAAGGADPPITNSCVDCHRGLFRGAFPDYRYKAPTD